MSILANVLREKVEPLVEEEGLEMVELQFSPAGPASVLRVFVDRTGGVTVGQCALISRKLGDFLDTENLIPTRYTLEVSSPGLDRPLTAAADFKRKTGEKVRIFLKEPVDGKTEMLGKIDNVQEQSLVFLESSHEAGPEGRRRVIPFDRVARAKIIL
jgi:ribosome maturation factor RimP